MTTVETNFLVWASVTLGSGLIVVLAYVGTSMVSKLDKIATSVGNIEKELVVLANDHTNLKEDHEELKERVQILERA